MKVLLARKIIKYGKTLWYDFYAKLDTEWPSYLSTFDIISWHHTITITFIWTKFSRIYLKSLSIFFVSKNIFLLQTHGFPGYVFQFFFNKFNNILVNSLYAITNFVKMLFTNCIVLEVNSLKVIMRSLKFQRW